MDMDEDRQFCDALRQALKHLYDPAFLRESPLVDALGLQDRSNVAGELRGILEQAIDELRLAAGSPPVPQARQRYEVLFYSFVRQLRQRDVANQLGISSRHVRREQMVAIEALTEYLRARCVGGAQPTQPMPPQGEASSIEYTGSAPLDQEMEWLGDSLAHGVTQVGPTLREALRLARTIADRHRVHLDLLTNDGLPPVGIAQTVLKQIALNLLTTAIYTVPNGHVAMSARPSRQSICIETVASAAAERALEGASQDGLDMAAQLVNLFDGDLSTSVEADRLVITVHLPRVDQVVVLAIEDNLDTYHLWERYVQETRYCLVSVRDPQKALTAARELDPDIILLDVMMPGMDGWELLGQLRHHPATAHIPVIVCTVLPQEELALALGANAFIRKPLTREGLRAALEAQIGAEARR